MGLDTQYQYINDKNAFSARATSGRSDAEKARGVVNAQDITGTARIIAGVQVYKNVRYRIGIAETKGRRSMTGGTIEVTPAVISCLHDLGDCAIELGSVLGWFRFIVTDVPSREIELTGWLNIGGFARTETRP